MMTAVSKYNPLSHYTWGQQCDGWNLVDEPALSVKQERMPAHSAEELHYHEYAQQFFYVLKGRAFFDIDDKTIEVENGNGILIKPGQKHKVRNNSESDLEFILCSAPSTRNDRINCSPE